MCPFVPGWWMYTRQAAPLKRAGGAIAWTCNPFCPTVRWTRTPRSSRMLRSHPSGLARIEACSPYPCRGPSYELPGTTEIRLTPYVQAVLGYGFDAPAHPLGSFIIQHSPGCYITIEPDGVIKIVTPKLVRVESAERVEVDAPEVILAGGGPPVAWVERSSASHHRVRVVGRHVDRRDCEWI